MVYSASFTTIFLNSHVGAARIADVNKGNPDGLSCVCTQIVRTYRIEIPRLPVRPLRFIEYQVFPCARLYIVYIIGRNLNLEMVAVEILILKWSVNASPFR